MAGLTDFSAITAALRQRNYALYTYGSAVSLVGMWVQRIAVGWLTWQLTRSGTWLGLIAFADLFPTVLFTPLAGVVADRVDRRRITIASQVLAMVQALLLGGLTLSGRIDIAWLFGLTLFVGVVWSFNTAARLAMVPNLVEHKYIPAAIALNSAVFNVARFIGPAAAGAIIATWGVGLAFLVNAATFTVFIVTLAKLRMVREEAGGRGRGGIMAETAEGLRYAGGHPGIGPMLGLLAVLAVGLKPFLELLPGFADAVFGRGATGLAELTASAGLGALVAALWLARRGTAAGLTAITVGSALLGGVSILAFTATAVYPLALVAVSFAGAAVVFGGTGTQTLMQNVVDGALRGRVMSLYGVIYRGGPALGALAMGAASEYVGLRPALAAGGVLCVVAWLWMIRRRRRIEATLEAVPRP